jgi:hypothetical protein
MARYRNRGNVSFHFAGASSRRGREKWLNFIYALFLGLLLILSLFSTSCSASAGTYMMKQHIRQL